MNINKSFDSDSINTSDNETEEENPREACSMYEGRCSAFGKLLTKDYQENFNNYNPVTSLYVIIKDNDRTKLLIYDIESGKEEAKMLDTPEPLNHGTCITQLPNGELFCLGNGPPSGIALIINSKREIRVLPSGVPCMYSSCIYFNNSVYCFGGDDDNKTLDRSFEFNLNENRWIALASMPCADFSGHSVIFNGNILISGFYKWNLLQYSIEIDSFSILPYEFRESTRKILIYTERLYLIDCGGLIYESEDEYHWNVLSESMLSYDYPSQVYCSYNYISATYDGIGGKYYKFDLSKKAMKKLSKWKPICNLDEEQLSKLKWNYYS